MMLDGRTTYSNGMGEPGLRDALAEKYTRTCGRPFSTDQFLCFPGTQASLFVVLMGVAETGGEVLVGDPMYATYEGVIRASGADMVPVPLKSENGFRISANDIAERITPQTTALLLTTPHNPTGAILNRQDIEEIGRLAIEHDLWIISDDRSGWCVGPTNFIEILLPLSEAIFFGNQPFIADMTEKAIREGSSVALGMSKRYSARAVLLEKLLTSRTELSVIRPQAGMFAMINVSCTGMSGDEYARDLLSKYAVAVMPGSSFGASIESWVRVALTIDDTAFEEACNRIISHANTFKEVVA